MEDKTRDEIIVIKSSYKNDQYGHLTVTDKADKEIRINKKHEHLHDLFLNNEGKAVKLTWKEYNFGGKSGEYVDDAVLVAVELAKQPDAPPVDTKLIEESAGGNVPPNKPSPQELGMWWKEAGELVRMWKLHPETKPDYPWVDALVRAYYAQMMVALPIKKEA